MGGELVEGGAGGVVGGRGEGDGAAFVAAFADGEFDGDLGEEGDAEAFGFMLAAAFAEDVVDVAVVRADEVAHVFDEADDGDVHFGEHGSGFAGVDEGDLLRGGDDDGAVEGDGLDNGELDIAGAGGEVEDEVVEVVPGDLAEELLGVAGGDGAADNDGGVVAEKEAHGDELEAVVFDGHDLLGVVLHGVLAGAHHEGDGGAVEVAVAEADAGTGLGEGDGEVGGDGAFADAAFAGGDGDDFFDAGDGGLAEGI